MLCSPRRFLLLSPRLLRGGGALARARRERTCDARANPLAHRSYPRRQRAADPDGAPFHQEPRRRVTQGAVLARPRSASYKMFRVVPARASCRSSPCHKKATHCYKLSRKRSRHGWGVVHSLPTPYPLPVRHLDDRVPYRAMIDVRPIAGGEREGIQVTRPGLAQQGGSRWPRYTRFLHTRSG